MPQWLTRWKTLEILAGDGRLQIGMAAGFKSERWPASNRNPGRLPVGIPGRLKSESASNEFRIAGQATDGVHQAHRVLPIGTGKRFRRTYGHVISPP